MRLADRKEAIQASISKDWLKNGPPVKSDILGDSIQFSCGPIFLKGTSPVLKTATLTISEEWNSPKEKEIDSILRYQYIIEIPSLRWTCISQPNEFSIPGYKDQMWRVRYERHNDDGNHVSLDHLHIMENGPAYMLKQNLDVDDFLSWVGEAFLKELIELKTT